MGKISFNDIKPPSGNSSNQKPKPSIRDVQIEGPNKERRERHAQRRMPDNFQTTPQIEKTTFPTNTQSTAATHADQPYTKPTKTRGIKNITLWLLASVVLAAILIFVTFIFIGKTTITLVPRTFNTTLTENVVHTAYRTPEEGELGFIPKTFTATLTKEVTASGTEHVERKASGKLIVYNTFGSSSQRIIKNTRFKSPDGLIYRVRNSFVIPGKKDSKPGSIEITVYADESGEEYNKPKDTRLSIPGLKNTDRYSKFYAKSISKIDGGFSGDSPVISEQDTVQAQKDLEAKLLVVIKKQIDEARKSENGLQIFDASLFTSFNTKQLPSDTSKNVTLSVTATTIVTAFDKTAFANELLKDTKGADYNGKKSIVTSDNLTFNLIKKEDIKPQTDELIQFTLAGDAEILWFINIGSLKNDLSGKPSNILDATLGDYPGIKDAKVTIRPFWKNSFPNAKAIKVITTPEE